MSTAPTRPTVHAARSALLSLLAIVVVLLVAIPAAAHPFIRGGGEVPVDSLAGITLDLAHGCGDEAAGAGVDTLEVALEVPDWLRVVEVEDHPDYDWEVEVDDAGSVEVVTWLAGDEPEPAPTFDLQVVASGSEGETRYLAVFQGCAEQTYRWIGTPDAPADDPAIRVVLVAADPDRPAPPEAPFEVPGAPVEEPVAEEDPAEDTEPADPPEAEDPAPEATDEAEEQAVTGDDPASADLAAVEAEEAGSALWLWVLMAVVGLVVAGVLAVVRRRAGGAGR